VLCFRVGMRLANRYLVMGDFTVGTIFTQPLADVYIYTNVSIIFNCNVQSTFIPIKIPI
jgi:hypothetical protein